ncbi:MAG: AmmeMemoRadiSam system protein B [Minisyncoccia bacterium]
MFIRSPQFAGTFYPNEPRALKEMIDKFLHQATVEKFDFSPKAIIVPHAGYIYSGPVAAYGFKILQNYSYQRIILLGPSHHFSFQGLALSPQGIWETPLGQVESLGKENLKEVKNSEEIIESSEIHEPEHCLEVELPYLQTILQNFKIIPFLTGEVNPQQAAGIIDKLLDETTLLVISSDLSHYYPYHEAQQLDKVTIDAILDNDIQRLEEYGEACGKTGIEVLIEIAQKRKWQSKLLCSLNSGEITGDKSQVVGYASIGYYSSLNSST